MPQENLGLFFGVTTRVGLFALSFISLRYIKGCRCYPSRNPSRNTIYPNYPYLVRTACELSLTNSR